MFAKQNFSKEQLKAFKEKMMKEFEQKKKQKIA